MEKRSTARLRRALSLPIRFYKAGSIPVTQDKIPVLSGTISAVFCLGVVFVPFLAAVIPLLGLMVGLPLLLLAFFASKTDLDPLLLPRRLFRRLRNPANLSAVELPVLRGWIVVVEIAVVIVTTVLTTQPFYASPANWQYSGNEAEWLTSTVTAAYSGLHESGRIPRWQPYLAQGEPLIENPFNFIFNPFASGPSLILGPVIGLRISIILSTFMAGLGGWFLGRVLGVGALGRVLLAMLLMGKGNLHAMLNSGYYQLALSQIYMPYVIGGVIAIFRWPKRRWPVVFTALALALQFLDGNIWYVLPTVVGAVSVAGVLLIGQGQRWLDVLALKRLTIIAIFAVGLSAVVALPVIVQFNYIGSHPDEVNAGWAVPLSQIVRLYFDPNPDQTLTIDAPVIGPTPSDHQLKEFDEFYDSYIIPVWYVLLILIFLPLFRPPNRREHHLWWVALILAALATLWGAGGKQPILLMYQHIPFLAQWRYVGRALAIATFWITVLLAMRVDALWKYVLMVDWSALLGVSAPWVKRFPIVLGSLLTMATLLAGVQVNNQWYKPDRIIREIDPNANNCITWLRQQYPNQPLSVRQSQYFDTTTYLNNHVRSWLIGADFEMLPQKPTVGSPQLDLNQVLPQYARLNLAVEVPWILENGYHVVPDSPSSLELPNCLYERTDALPYAYTITQAQVAAMNQPPESPNVNLSAFTPVHWVEQRTDQVALIVTGARTQPTLVGVQEKAYPGWRVVVNGEPAQLESLGGQIGVRLPLGDKPVQVYFVYEPILPVIGGILTLVTALGCIIFLITEGHRRSTED